MTEPKRLLLVAHAPSPNLARLRDAVLEGARDPEIAGVETVFKLPLEAGPDDVLAADAIILGTPENLGYMSGALKDFFDRTYYSVIDDKQGLPFAAYIRAGKDGTGTKRAIESITTGLSWRPVQEPMILHGQFQEAFVDQVRDLGQAMAAGLEAGIF
jgi:multimeric flavodoxin WrbA